MTRRKTTPAPRLGVEPLLEDRTVPCGAACMMDSPGTVAALAALPAAAAAAAAPPVVQPAAPTAAARAGSPVAASPTQFLFPDTVVTRTGDDGGVVPVLAATDVGTAPRPVSGTEPPAGVAAAAPVLVGEIAPEFRTI